CDRLCFLSASITLAQKRTKFSFIRNRFAYAIYFCYRASPKTPNLDSRVRGNDIKVPYHALRALLLPFVIPAKAGIHEFSDVPYSNLFIFIHFHMQRGGSGHERK